MTITEPADHAYVSVQLPDGGSSVYRRNNLAAGGLPARWFSQGGEQGPITWAEVAALGPILYVGAVADQRP